MRAAIACLPATRAPAEGTLLNQMFKHRIADLEVLTKMDLCCNMTGEAGVEGTTFNAGFDIKV